MERAPLPQSAACMYKQTARAVFRSFLGSLARTPPSGFYRGPESSSAAGRSPSITLARGQIKMHNGRVQHIYYWTGDKRAIYRAEKCDSTLLSGHLKPLPFLSGSDTRHFYLLIPSKHASRECVWFLFFFSLDQPVINHHLVRHDTFLVICV